MASSKRAEKPSAAARTVDLFTGKTNVEAAEEAERIANNADIKEDRHKTSEPMEVSAERWREKAFECQEWSSKLFPLDPSGTEPYQFRITRRQLSTGDRMLYVERLHVGGEPGSGVSSYAGLMIHESSFLQFAQVVVEAARKVKSNE